MLDAKPAQTKINVDAPVAKMTEAEFDAHWEKFALSNPAKYAVRLGSGDIEKQREKLFGKKEVKHEAKEEKVVGKTK